MSRIRSYCKFVRQRLDEEGFVSTESSCNEWNADSGMRGSYLHAAKTAATLIVFQNEAVDNAMFYDARFGAGRYSGIFSPETAAPYPAYYAFTAFNRLYQLENQVSVSCEDDNLFIVAASDGKRGTAVIVNPTKESIPMEIDANGEQIITLITTDGAFEAPGGLKSFDPKCDSAIPMPASIPAESIITVIYNV